jgi:hypothetical protein
VAEDLHERLRAAAASPTRDAPLPLIETRLRRRRSLRRGAAGACVVALVAGIGGGVALTADDGPSIRAGVEAAATVAAYTEPSVTVDLPDGWFESPIEAQFRTDHEILTVGTAMLPPGAPHLMCTAAAEFQDDVFVKIKEYTKIVVLSDALEAPTIDQAIFADQFVPRPEDFAVAPARTLTCDPSADPALGWSGVDFSFQDNGRMFEALVSFGPTSAPERQAEAYAVLNSLVVEAFEPPPPPPVPLSTVPPSTAPPSAETEAITAAFLGWIDTRPIDASGVYIEDFASIREAIIGAAAANGRPDEYTGRVEAITRVGENDADVIYSFIIDGQPVVANLTGHAVKIDGVWLVSRDTVCEALLMGPVHCPPRE